MLIAFILAATLYRVEPTNGTVNFTIMKWGVLREEGTFRDFHAKIDLDQKNVAQSSVYFEVDTNSVDTKNANRDGTLRSIDFFDVARHPRMTFRSVSVAPRRDGLANVTGDLTIRGITKRITVPVRLLGVTTKPKPMAGFETTFTINRHAFGLTGGRWTAGAPGVLANDVTIYIRAGGIAN